MHTFSSLLTVSRACMNFPVPCDPRPILSSFVSSVGRSWWTSHTRTPPWASRSGRRPSIFRWVQSFPSLRSAVPSFPRPQSWRESAECSRNQCAQNSRRLRGESDPNRKYPRERPGKNWCNSLSFSLAKGLKEREREKEREWGKLNRGTDPQNKLGEKGIN